MTKQFQLHPKKQNTLLETLKNESESAVNWFRKSNMLVNPEKSQSILLQKSTKKVIKGNTISIITKSNPRTR